MQALTDPDEQLQRSRRRQARIQISLLILVFAAPVLLSYIWYFLVHPAATASYGTLLAVHPLPDVVTQNVAGATTPLSSYKGHWVLIAQDHATCDDGCQSKLYAMRQVRAALGHDDLRVERVLLLEDGAVPNAEVQQRFDGTHFLRLTGPSVLTGLDSAADERHDYIWLVDPLGNLVMRYPSQPDLKRMLKDLERLLKASMIG